MYIFICVAVVLAAFARFIHFRSRSRSHYAQLHIPHSDEYRGGMCAISYKTHFIYACKQYFIEVEILEKYNGPFFSYSKHRKLSQITRVYWQIESIRKWRLEKRILQFCMHCAHSWNVRILQMKCAVQHWHWLGCNYAF